MNNFFRTIIAGYGAKKLGGGCLSTIVIFILIYVALGQCNRQSVAATKINSKSPSFVTNRVEEPKQLAGKASVRTKQLSHYPAGVR